MTCTLAAEAESQVQRWTVPVAICGLETIC